MGALLNQARDEAADEGDEEFWGQAAFAEARACALRRPCVPR